MHSRAVICSKELQKTKKKRRTADRDRVVLQKQTHKKKNAPKIIIKK